MEDIFIIISSQEYDKANHQELWKELASQNNSPVIVVNIPADFMVSVVKGRIWRIKEAMKPVVNLGNNLFLARPLFILRPEICPVFLYKVIAFQFWKKIQECFPDINNRKINLLIYNAFWVKILKGSHPNLNIGYYLFDEVRYNAHDNSINKKRYKEDEFACANSNFLLTISQKLADSRKAYNSNIKVIGNGAVKPLNNYAGVRIPKSVAFIGNFRNWVDKDLLRGIIESRPDLMFAFVGNVETNMKLYLEDLLNNYRNTAYFGKVCKNRIHEAYQMFSCVIVPYLQNEFIQATRPIKIVESVLAGTPVVTIPMDGYSQSDYIKFATDVDGFCKEIDFFIDHSINTEDERFKDFIDQNTWKCKASKIIQLFNLY